MNLICIFFGLLFMASGLLFALGKVHIHLALWRRMPMQQRNTLRIVPLCRNIGAVIALCGVIFALRGLLGAFTQQLFTWSMLGWFLLAGFDVWYIGTSRRYIR